MAKTSSEAIKIVVTNEAGTIRSHSWRLGAGATSFYIKCVDDSSSMKFSLHGPDPRHVSTNRGHIANRTLTTQLSPLALPAHAADFTLEGGRLIRYAAVCHPVTRFHMTRHGYASCSRSVRTLTARPDAKSSSPTRHPKGAVRTRAKRRLRRTRPLPSMSGVSCSPSPGRRSGCSRRHRY